MKNSKDNILSEDIPTINTDDLNVKEPDRIIEPNVRYDKDFVPKSRPAPKSKPPADPFASVKRLQRMTMVYRVVFVLLLIGTGVSTYLAINKRIGEQDKRLDQISEYMKLLNKPKNNSESDEKIKNLESLVLANSVLLKNIDSAMSEDQQKLTDEVNKLKSANSKLQGENSILSASIASLKKSMESKAGDTGKLLQQINTLEEKLKTVELDKKKLENDMNSLNMKMKAQDAQFRSLNEDKMSLSKLNDKMQDEYKALKKDFDKLNKTNEDNLKDIIKYRAAVDGLEALLKKNKIGYRLNLNIGKKTEPDADKEKPAAKEEPPKKTLDLYRNEDGSTIDFNKYKKNSSSLEKTKPTTPAKPAATKSQKPDTKVKESKEEDNNGLWWVW